MSPELWISLAKILISVALLTGVLFAASRFGKRIGLSAEGSRKVVHVGLGLYCLTFPWLFHAWWEVAATCALALVVFWVARGVGRRAIGEGLHGVGRISYGEVLFAVSVVLLFHLKDGHYVLQLNGLQSGSQPILYLLPLLMLTLCDATSALVGVHYGRHEFQVETGKKSWEGVAAFVITAWLVSLIALLLFSDQGRVDVIVIAGVCAVFGALFEGASWKGLDNLFIPMGLYFLLSNLMPGGSQHLLIVSGLFIGLAAALVPLGRRFGFSRHVVAATLTLLFLIAIFSGPLSLLTPLATLAAYGLIWRQGLRKGTPHDPLNLVVVIMAISLAFFLFSDFASRDTIFVYNLSFAALAVAILARFASKPRPLRLGLACLLAWGVACVRILWVEGPNPAAPLFAGVALALIVLSALAAHVLGRRGGPRPWVELGALALIAGFAGLPWSP